jgi:hypothetical protein
MSEGPRNTLPVNTVNPDHPLPPREIDTGNINTGQFEPSPEPPHGRCQPTAGEDQHELQGEPGGASLHDSRDYRGGEAPNVDDEMGDGNLDMGDDAPGTGDDDTDDDDMDDDDMDDDDMDDDELLAYEEMYGSEAYF